jgi:4-aminobutyrate aminotransferase-like enzyme
MRSKTATVLELLRAYESRNVTFLEPDGSWPIVWARAKGVHVWDADGKQYLDLTAGFGVAATGHANPRVLKAGQQQMARLLHALGDVHPHEWKARLARELSRLTFERWTATNPKSEIRNPKSAKTIFCNSGFEAVEAALKTAFLATGKGDIIAFQGGYHGLGYGALVATHREHFRGRFRPQLCEFGHFVRFPTSLEELENTLHAVERLCQRHNIGAVLVEPAQGRGGIRVPARLFLMLLREVCSRHGALLIADEIFTGFGRTGRWFACEHSGVAPDLICLGKAIAGGFPISACVGRADVMDAAWPPSTGEAIHTSTFLGHPVGCAMALAQIAEIERQRLVERSARLGAVLLEALQSQIPNLKSHLQARGLGLMAGLELRLPDGLPATALALRAIKAMLHRGFILLPEGEHSNVISFTPPLTISEGELRRTVHTLAEVLAELDVPARGRPRPQQPEVAQAPAKNPKPHPRAKPLQAWTPAGRPRTSKAMASVKNAPPRGKLIPAAGQP